MMGISVLGPRCRLVPTTSGWFALLGALSLRLNSTCAVHLVRLLVHRVSCLSLVRGVLSFVFIGRSVAA
jgi:hypothetical protein